MKGREEDWNWSTGHHDGWRGRGRGREVERWREMVQRERERA